MQYIIEFADASDRAVAGGKGYGLYLLTSWDLEVPSGVVLGTRAYNEAISSPELAGLIESGEASTIRDSINNLEFWPALANEIEQAWADLTSTNGTDLRVSCRSSATAEDSAAASFAGQFATVLGVAGPDGIANAVKQCWASAWSDEALAYRNTANTENDRVSMAVVIQKMVRADTSGVAFSINPVTGDDSEIMVNSSWGLGETVVSGLVSPDMFTVQKPDMQITGREISQTKSVRHVVAQDGSIEEQSVPYADAMQPSLTDEQVAEVASMACLAEEKAGSPQDIEWAYEAGTLYLLQTRPITTV